MLKHTCRRRGKEGGAKSVGEGVRGDHLTGRLCAYSQVASDLRQDACDDKGVRSNGEGANRE